MNITPEMIDALNTLRSFAERNKNAISIGGNVEASEAINVLDNARVFAPIDEATGYDVKPSYTFTVDDVADIKPDAAEWGDTTREDMARHQIGGTWPDPGSMH